VIKESTEEFASGEAKSALEERGKHHNLGHIGCRNVFAGAWDAMAARCDQGESDSQQVCESHFHLQRTAEKGADVR
jgi:hypothetical protein